MKHLIGYTLATFIVTFILMATPAYADCFHNGYWYPTWYRIGPYVCMPDSTWSYRP